MKRIKFSVGNTDFSITNTSMERYGRVTGTSHLALTPISDERVEGIARFMEYAAEEAIIAAAGIAYGGEGNESLRIAEEIHALLKEMRATMKITEGEG